MADTKISDLTDGSPLVATDDIPVARAGTNRRVRIDLSAYATAAQGALADTAVQPARLINSGTGIDGGGDLSADRTLALDAATIASLALADKLPDPTGQSAGNVLRTGGSDNYTLVSELVAPLAQYLYGTASPGRMWAADNFEVRSSSPATDLTGKAYTNKTVGLGTYITLDTSGLAVSTNARNFRFFIADETRLASEKTALLLWKDNSNFLEIRLGSRNAIAIIETLAGVATTLATNGGNTGDGPERFIFSREVWWDNRDRRVYFRNVSGGVTIVVQSALSDAGSLNAVGFMTVDPGFPSGVRLLNYRAELK